MAQLIQEHFVNIENNLHVARQHALQHVNGPSLQRLGHQCMVGVREYFGAQPPCQRPG